MLLANCFIAPKAASISRFEIENDQNLVVGPTADIKIPVLASSHLFLLKIEKEGYITVYQPFDVALNADMEYEFTMKILTAGDPA